VGFCGVAEALRYDGVDRFFIPVFAGLYGRLAKDGRQDHGDEDYDT
jgi:hypothetical protein